MPTFTRFLLALVLCCMTAETAFGLGKLCSVPASGPSTYVVPEDVKLNSVSKIAKSVYGPELMMKGTEGIVQTTPGLEDHPHLIKPGDKLLLPCLDTFVVKAEVSRIVRARPVVMATSKQEEVAKVRVYCNIADCPDDARVEDEVAEYAPKQFVAPFGTGPMPWNDVWVFDEPDLEGLELPEVLASVSPGVEIDMPILARIDFKTYAIRNKTPIPQPPPAVAVAKAIPTPAPVAPTPIAPTPKAVQTASVSSDAKAVVATDKVSPKKVSTDDAPKKAKKAKRAVLYVRHEYIVDVSDAEGVDAGSFPAIRSEDCNQFDQCDLTDISVAVEKIPVGKQEDKLLYSYIATVVVEKTKKPNTWFFINFNGHIYPIMPQDLPEGRGVTVRELPKRFADEEYGTLHAAVPQKDSGLMKWILRPCIERCVQVITSAMAGPAGWGMLGLSFGSQLVPDKDPGAEPPPLPIQYSQAQQSKESAEQKQEIATLRQTVAEMKNALDTLQRNSSTTLAQAK